MIKIINGILGGGKTSFAVSYVYSLAPNKIINKPIINDPDYKGDYKKVYTNISGFKGDDFTIPVEFLNFDILEKCALVLLLIFQNNRHIQDVDKEMNSFYDQVADSVSFDELQSDFDLSSIEIFYEDIKGFRFNRVLFAIDEFIDYFQDKKEHLIKWFSWSRHLYQDMILIQNDISDVPKVYKGDKVVKHYIQASDPENRWHPSLFKYAYHTKSLQPKSGDFKIKHVWIPKWIFDKYESGQIQNAFPKIYKYLIFFLLLIFILAYFIYSVLHKSDNVSSSRLSSEPELETHAIALSSEPIVNNSNLTYNYKIKLHIRAVACFKCSSDTCLYKNDIYTIERIKATIKAYNFKLFYSVNNPLFSEYCYHVNKSFFKQYKKSTKKRFVSSKISSFALP